MLSKRKTTLKMAAAQGRQRRRLHRRRLGATMATEASSAASADAADAAPPPAGSNKLVPSISLFCFMSRAKQRRKEKLFVFHLIKS